VPDVLGTRGAAVPLPSPESAAQRPTMIEAPRLGATRSDRHSEAATEPTNMAEPAKTGQ
jgi:hypothetical protein